MKQQILVNELNEDQYKEIVETIQEIKLKEETMERLTKEIAEQKKQVALFLRKNNIKTLAISKINLKLTLNDKKPVIDYKKTIENSGLEKEKFETTRVETKEITELNKQLIEQELGEFITYVDQKDTFTKTPITKVQ